MKERLRKINIIRYVLMIMILFSIFLSWKIWTSPKMLDFDQNTSSNVLFQEKNPEDVFLPTSVIYRKDQNSFYSNKESLISNLQSLLDDSVIQDIQLMSRNSEELYRSLHQQEGMLILSYNDLFLFQNYQNIFLKSSSYNDEQQIYFNQILFSLLDESMYLVDEFSLKIYEVELDQTSMSLYESLHNAVTKKMVLNRKVSLGHEQLPHLYYFEDEVSLKKYSYILATQPYTIYSKTFFNDTTDLYSEDTQEILSLSNPENEYLTIHYSTGEVFFLGQDRFASVEDHSIFMNSFEYIAHLGNALGPVRYFYWDEKSVVIYKNYIEGFPVFGMYDHGQISVKKMINNHIEIKTNRETIQIPIPSEEMITLSSTMDVLEELKQVNFPLQEIEDIQIGYTWHMNNETSQVVDLIPEWYVKKNGKWKSLAHWKEEWKGKELDHEF